TDRAETVDEWPEALAETGADRDRHLRKHRFLPVAGFGCEVLRCVHEQPPQLLARLDRLQAHVEGAEKEAVSLGYGFGALGHFAKQPVAALGERVVETHELDEEQPLLLEVAIEHAEDQAA